MIQNKKRKEITLDQQTLAILKDQAERQGRNLKNYMEHVLYEKAHNFQVTDEYKAMMDDILDDHKHSKISYTSWDEVKKTLGK